MPTYEYRCDNGHTFDVLQSMAEDALDTCTVCGAPARRVLHAPAVHFKGSGFYTTDYARKGKKTPASESGSDSSGSSSEGSSSDGKGDASKSGTSGDGNGSSSKSESSKGGAAKD
jgi:putative FmdB family regulatory protein